MASVIDEQKLKDWKDKFKNQWKYNKELVVFEDENGKQITPSTTTTTTTTTTSTTRKPNVTSIKPPFTSNVTVYITTESPVTPAAATAETTQIIRIVGISCGVFIGIILLALLCICCCRRSAAKRNKRMTVRRPLFPAEPETDHIYAEIEPLQRPGGSGQDGATGTSADVKLPKKKKPRRSGVSSFRAISTRIYKFFSADTDDEEAVSYNPTSHNVNFSPPVPPDRNTINGKTKSRTGVSRGESTASRRPLLHDDSIDSNDRRSHIYNPLQREKTERASGPYDHLAVSKTRSGHVEDPENSPDSPHDYFMLEKKTRESQEMDDEAEYRDSDNLMVENEIEHMDTIDEDAMEDSETPKLHDYFVLEPHERVDEGKTGVVKPAQGKSSSIKSQKSPSKSPAKVDSLKDTKVKPEAKPRVTKQASAQSPNSSKHDDSPKRENMDKNEGRKSVDELYVLSKMGDAPQPPDSANETHSSVDDDEYLTPKEVHKPDYVDVIPEPPDRTSSLEPHGSPIVNIDKKGIPVNSPRSPTQGHGSPLKSPKSPTKGEISPVKSKASSIKGQGSPRSNMGSPIRKGSPTKRTPSPEKTALHSPVTVTNSIVTDV
ncbi:muscle M-line assembly protein unc-89-like isoform X2 [Mya arenaria]|uniref:muscle M-line assembly protein unc-89-like isoform X2 n=1 Tax=Mya arenaria TaxID=6604 RepID=UPI0022E435EE|nr:muscle M-line assembly protein unc-89-like isoform X2 [Mya arenaria]